jgi:hypothetical protein
VPRCRRPLPRSLWIGSGAALLGAALSLLLPYQPLYDPWGWLVWGRELTRFDLATAQGMSWKPLPVLVDAPLSLLGQAAPKGWLFVARSGWLLAPLLAGWLALRLSGEETGRWRFAAAALAAGSVVLTADSFTPAARQFSGGLSEPLLVALVLGAVVAALERRPLAALWLGFAASLLRPECWPLLAAWALWQGRREPRLRPHALAVALLVPLAWFVPDLLGAGDPLAGSRTARGGPIEPLDAFSVLGRALAAPLAAAWLGVGLVLLTRPAEPRPDQPPSPELHRLLYPGGRQVDAVREGGRGWRLAGRSREDLALVALLAGALAWIVLVALMAVVGFAGLPRFLAPATAAVAVVGGVGVARAGARLAVDRSLLLAVAASLALVAGLIQLGARAAEAPGDLRDVERQATLVDGMFELAEWVPRERLLTCGGRVRLANLLTPPTALAWKLDLPLASVRTIAHPGYGVALSTRALPGRRIAQVGRWRATDLGC